MQTIQPDYEQVQELLPESVQQIASLIGFPATSKLIQQFGGVQFRIGKGLRSSGQRRIALLQETLTPEQVALLMQHFSGEDLYIPRCQDAWREWRNRCFLAEIEQLKAEGESLTMALTLLCPKYGIAATRAWELLRERDQQEQFVEQRSLF
ncbi:Mor transcription activator family [Serratia marcescens]|uniref:Mor transcription activator family protein n=1 Tax=Serratia marcescens TaxID=615 RepID=UPI00074548A4|nr:Mor transcription activator family protein [Serratia marcescens]CUZ68218.1 Mor transcription activator family [Serratia marcescens]CVF21313.1 Mor transcription activator family [Serratia marcescens]CVG48559.1 Mor transcription activator family [Serratia marcescens]